MRIALQTEIPDLVEDKLVTCSRGGTAGPIAASMKPGAHLVNVSRANLVDQLLQGVVDTAVGY